MKKYIKNVLVGIDQLVNALLAGDPDETLSSRMGKQPDCTPCRIVCWFLDKIDSRHCKKYIESDEGKNDLLT